MFISAGPCSPWAPIDFRIRGFTPSGSLAFDRLMTCGAGSDYLDLGNIPPGTYDLAIETPSYPCLVGGDLILSSACDVDRLGGLGCRPVRVELPPCDLRVVPVMLACEKVGDAGVAP